MQMSSMMIWLKGNIIPFKFQNIVRKLHFVSLMEGGGGGG